MAVNVTSYKNNIQIMDTFLRLNLFYMFSKYAAINLEHLYSSVQAEQCTTDFVQNCEEREERVCGEVTETLCEVTPTIYFPPFFYGFP